MIRSRLHHFFVIAIFIWVAGAGLFLAKRDSMTTDEGIHVASAYLALTRHEFRFDPEHPYLFKFLTALPLFALNLHTPKNDLELWNRSEPTLSDWWKEARSWSDQWVYTSSNNADQMMFLARIPGVLCLLILCFLVYRFAYVTFSPQVGFYSLIFTAFNPTLLAHGHLANTDVPVALAMFASLWALWAYWQSPTLKRALVVGLLCGIAQIIKFSAVILLPIIFFWLLYCAAKKNTYSLQLGHFCIILFMTWAIIWIQYLPFMLISGDPIFDIKGSQTLPEAVRARVNDRVTHGLLALRFILPLDYAKGLLLVLTGSYLGRPTYLLGQSYPIGVWYYFPILYLFKSQVIGIFLLGFGMIRSLVNCARTTFTQEPVHVLLGSTALIFIVISLANKLNIGIRHITVLLPILSIYMSFALINISAIFRRNWIAPVVFILYCLPIIIQLPNMIGYSNIFVYPPEKAYYYFNDSNIDWGQQSKDIAQVVKEEFNNEPLYADFRWNPYALSYYGLTIKPLHSAQLPQEGLILLTATQLASNEFSYFRDLKPVASVQNNSFFYRMPGSDKVQ